MVAEKFSAGNSRTRNPGDGALAVSVVDNWHREWAKVLESIDAAGHRDVLMLDLDGWLSARQSVVAAFAGGRAVGHLIFHVAPITAESGAIALEARVDAIRAGDNQPETQRMLAQAAETHARNVLQCQKFRMD